MADTEVSEEISRIEERPTLEDRATLEDSATRIDPTNDLLAKLFHEMHELAQEMKTVGVVKRKQGRNVGKTLLEVLRVPLPSLRLPYQENRPQQLNGY